MQAKGRFGSLSVNGDYLVISRKDSLIGSEQITVHRSDITAVTMGKGGMGERYIRFTVPGAFVPTGRGRNAVVRDRYALLFWKRRTPEFEQIASWCRQRA